MLARFVLVSGLWSCDFFGEADILMEVRFVPDKSDARQTDTYVGYRLVEEASVSVIGFDNGESHSLAGF